MREAWTPDPPRRLLVDSPIMDPFAADGATFDEKLATIAAASIDPEQAVGDKEVRQLCELIREAMAQNEWCQQEVHNRCGGHDAMVTRRRLQDVERELEDLRGALEQATGNNQILNRENSELRQHIWKLEASCSADPSARCCIASASSRSPPGSPNQERGRSLGTMGTAGAGRGMGSTFLHQSYCDTEVRAGGRFVDRRSVAGSKSSGERSLSLNSSRWLHDSSASGRVSPRVGGHYPCLAQAAYGLSVAAASGMSSTRLRARPLRRPASVASNGRSASPGPGILGGTVAIANGIRAPMSPPLRVRSNSPAPPAPGLSTVAGNRPAVRCFSTLSTGQVVSAGAATAPTPAPVALQPAWAPLPQAVPTLLGPNRMPAQRPHMSPKTSSRQLAACPKPGAQPRFSPRMVFRSPTPLR